MTTVRDEQGRFQALTDQIEGTTPDEPEVVETPEVEGEDADLAAEARKYGWRPREEFTKTPESWVDAARFMELGSTKFKMERDRSRELTDRLARIEQTTAAALQRVREQERQAYEAKIAQVRNEQLQAVEAADTEAYNLARQREAALLRSAPPAPEAPAVALPKWAEDPQLRAFGAQAIEDAPGIKSLPFEKQIEWAEKRVREVYPERFEVPKPKPEMRQRVDGGGLASLGKRDRGVDELPAEDRKVGEMFVKEKVFPSIEAYAKAYWAQEKR